MSSPPPQRPSGKRAPQPERPAPKAEARRPGHLATGNEQDEEHVADPEHALRTRMQAAEQAARARIERPNEAKKAQKDLNDRERQRRGQGGGQEEQKEQTTAGMLAHNAAFARSSVDRARSLGFQQTPGIGEILSGKQAPREGESLGELLPQARMRARPELPDVKMRPPPFLTPLEAMKDIYMRVRGRMSRKTQELLESVDLEDLIGALAKLQEDEALLRKSEARLGHALWSQLKDDPGPLLLGLNDPRLAEPWRLFLDRWEIWVPDGEEEGGVELFWEGEGEDDDGTAIELLQSLTYKRGELVLYAKLGAVEDRITFDGETFYRLKSDQSG